MKNEMVKIGCEEEDLVRNRHVQGRTEWYSVTAIIAE